MFKIKFKYCTKAVKIKYLHQESYICFFETDLFMRIMQLEPRALTTTSLLIIASYIAQQRTKLINHLNCIINNDGALFELQVYLGVLNLFRVILQRLFSKLLQFKLLTTESLYSEFPPSMMMSPASRRGSYKKKNTSDVTLRSLIV